ncbi:MAG: HNH endonuclease signature motif containing protein [Candidatus Nanopelagicales bacterium]
MDAETGKRSSAEDHQRRGRSSFDIGLGAHPVLLARVLCDQQIRLIAELGDGRGIDLGRTRRRTTTRQRAAVLRRDGGACRYPGCAARRHLHLHHVRHWIHGGATDSDNLITLCGFHHRRLHEQAYSIATPDPGRFTFWLPDGRPLPEHPPVQPTPGAPPLTRDDSLHPAAYELRKAAARYARGQRLHLNAAVGALLGA